MEKLNYGAPEIFSKEKDSKDINYFDPKAELDKVYKSEKTNPKEWPKKTADLLSVVNDDAKFESEMETFLPDF